MRKHIPTIVFLAIMFMAGAAIFLLGASWANSIYREAVQSQKEALQGKLIFCKDCCWKTKYLYTCADTKKELWRYTP